MWQVADQSYGLLRVFCVCPDEAEGSTLQPHEGADALDKQGGRLIAHPEKKITIRCSQYT